MIYKIVECQICGKKEGHPAENWIYAKIYEHSWYEWLSYKTHICPNCVKNIKKLAGMIRGKKI